MDKSRTAPGLAKHITDNINNKFMRTDVRTATGGEAASHPKRAAITPQNPSSVLPEPAEAEREDEREDVRMTLASRPAFDRNGSFSNMDDAEREGARMTSASRPAHVENGFSNIG